MKIFTNLGPSGTLNRSDAAASVCLFSNEQARRHDFIDNLEMQTFNICVQEKRAVIPFKSSLHRYQRVDIKTAGTGHKNKSVL